MIPNFFGQKLRVVGIFLSLFLILSTQNCTRSGAPVEEEPAVFVLGGVNKTEEIKKLRALNNTSIELLEQRMRPGKLKRPLKLSDPMKYRQSTQGFLGPEESLVSILAADNDFVVSHMRLTHQELAKPLTEAVELLRASGKTEITIEFPPTPEKGPATHRIYFIDITKWCQPSPFGTGKCGSAIVGVSNLKNGAQLVFSDMMPQLIHDYGFYEGKGTPWRVPPEAIVETFEYLKPIRVTD